MKVAEKTSLWRSEQSLWLLKAEKNWLHVEAANQRWTQFASSEHFRFRRLAWLYFNASGR